MPALSTRFVWLTLAIVAASAVAVAATRMEPRRNDPCADPGGLTLRGFPGVEDVRRDVEALKRPYMIQYERGVVRSGEGARRRARFEVQINRSWEPRVLYERPGTWVKGLENAERHDFEGDDGGVPTHFITNFTTAAGRIAAYTYVYGNQSTASPFGVQIRNGWEELRNGKQPLTMLVVSGGIRPRYEEAWRVEARAWLAAAVAHYQSVCGD